MRTRTERAVRLLALAGDGIGPEIMDVTLRLLRRHPRLTVEIREAGHG
jgi:isocitrate/isopropylmalate dehydrogenase